MHTSAARFQGTLKKWNVERGFGFVVAEHGDQDLFVHVSAFPRDGQAPMVGETLSFEIEQGADGRKRAVRVRRPHTATGEASHSRDRTTSMHHRSESRHSKPPASSSSMGARFISVLLVAALGWFGYGYFQEQKVARPLAAQSPQGAMGPSSAAQVGQEMPAPAFQCDGRLHCSQMTSCAEAKLFLKHCPGVKMDGDGDGVPCEQQWCTGAFGN